MTILKTDTVSGIGTEGTVFEGDITFDSLNYMTLPKGKTAERLTGARGIFAGGRTPAINVIQYWDFTSVDPGVALDFGDLTTAIRYAGGCGSNTRGIIYNGYQPVALNRIEYITISTTGNASDFGDLTSVRRGVISFSSNTRGIFAGGYTPTLLNNIEFVTIASEGNSKDFGDLSDTGQHNPGAISDGMRGHIGGGGVGPSPSLIGLQAVTIPTMGNSFAFGDLLIAGTGGDGPAGISDGHGGLT